MTPTIGANKAVAAGMAGAVSVLLIWIIGLFHIAVPPEIASAITTLAGTVSAYVIPTGGSSS